MPDGTLERQVAPPAGAWIETQSEGIAEKPGQARKLCYQENKSYKTYKTYIEGKSPEMAANTLICVIHQTNYLLDQQLRVLEKEFIKAGGFTERLYRTRLQARRQTRKR